MKNTSEIIQWQNVSRVLVVRLRSIGDTVLSTPSLIALRRFLPEAQIDILLEDWVEPVLEGFEEVDNVIALGKGMVERMRVARLIRRKKYDVVFNLHGGTTGTFFCFASGANFRVGLSNYQYSFLYNCLLSSPADFWHQEKMHSAEQQLAMLGFVGVPVEDRPKSRLGKSEFPSKVNIDGKFAIIHPAAAFAEKQWAAEKFARVAEFLDKIGLRVIAVASENETELLRNLQKATNAPIITHSELTLPEIAGLAAKAEIFIGNDSGIAHIAAAVNTPVVVIFGASNIDHWRPWADTPNEVVYSTMDCDHFRGRPNEGTEKPHCIQCVEVEQVKAAVLRLIT